MAGTGILTKEMKDKQNCEKQKRLPQEIERLKKELNKRIAQGGNGLSNEETMKLSQRLDELLVEHLLGELGLLKKREKQRSQSKSG